jgi:hypothetical protein
VVVAQTPNHSKLILRLRHRASAQNDVIMKVMANLIF